MYGPNASDKRADGSLRATGSCLPRGGMPERRRGRRLGIAVAIVTSPSSGSSTGHGGEAPGCHIIFEPAFLCDHVLPWLLYADCGPCYQARTLMAVGRGLSEASRAYARRFSRTPEGARYYASVVRALARLA